MQRQNSQQSSFLEAGRAKGSESCLTPSSTLGGGEHVLGPGQPAPSLSESHLSCVWNYIIFWQHLFYLLARVASPTPFQIFEPPRLWLWIMACNGVKEGVSLLANGFESYFSSKARSTSGSWGFQREGGRTMPLIITSMRGGTKAKQRLVMFSIEATINQIVDCCPS